MIHPRARILLLSSVLALTVALAAPAVSAARGCARASASPSSISSASAVKTTVCLINRERRKHGRRGVRLNRRLSRAAARHARDMVRRGYFSHFSPSGQTFLARIKRTGYLRRARAWSAGENLAWGSGRRATPRAIVSAWMHSPGHRANVLNGRFREVGMAIVRAAPGGSSGPAATYVNTFGSRR